MNLKEHREKKKWSIEDLSKASGVPSGIIRRMEDRGERCSRNQLSSLAKALGIKVEVLLGK